MIQNIYVYNYLEMKNNLVNLPPDARIIGCTDVGGLVREPLFETDDYKLALRFDDCVPVDIQDDYKPLSKEQAEQIVRYVMRLIDGRIRHDLYVHCVAGRSRSAAIAKFAAWVSGLDERYIKTDNKFFPNEYVFNLLQSTYKKLIMSGVV
jgi:predicted protein tyrosine phosphatase